MILGLIHTAGLGYKRPIIQDVHYNIKNQSIAMDVATWECWAQVSSVLGLDVARFLRQGWLSADAGSKYFGVPGARQDNLMRLQHFYFRQSVGYHTAAHILYDSKVLNTSFPHLINLEKWIDAEVNVPFLS